MKKFIKNSLLVLLAMILTVSALPLISMEAEAASYPAVSLEVPYYRQRASGMCSFCAFSMAEAYATGYGANEDVVYQAIRTAHGYASDGGYKSDPYASPALIDGKKYKEVSTSYETIYSYLKQGIPVVIYRGGSTMHWAVIYGYNGSTSTLQTGGFQVINGVYVTDNNYVKKETLTTFLSASDATLLHAVVRVNGVLAHKNNTSYSQNMNSYFANCSVSSITSTNATIKGIFTNSTSISSAGFYIGTSSSSLKKVSKNLSGGSDGAGTYRSIYYSMNKWYGTLTAGTKYYYQLYYIKNGTEYKSPVNWFVTTGSKTATSISIKSGPTSYSYSFTSGIKVEGLELYVNYSDGTQKTVTSGYTLSIVGMTADSVDVKITYETASMTVTVTRSGIITEETTTKAPETTTKAPETTTKAPETTTKAPETTTKAPETTTKAPETTTKAPETTTAPVTETTTEDTAQGSDLYSLGDVNNDGKINAADARLALRSSAKLEYLTLTQLLAADVNKDSKVNASDARIILRIAASLESINDYL